MNTHFRQQPKLCDNLLDAMERVFNEHFVGEPFDFLGRNGDEYRRCVGRRLLRRHVCACLASRWWGPKRVVCPVVCPRPVDNVPVHRERVYHVDVSEVLIRYSKLLRAVHGTFARTTKINKSRKVCPVSSVGR